MKAVERVLTRDEVLGELLQEVQGVHNMLQSILSWVVFGGIVLLVSIAVSACGAVMSWL